MKLPLLAAAALTVSALHGQPPLRIATFRADVTPPLGTPLCCNGLVEPARQIVDPLTARGIVIIGAGRPIVLAAVDWVGIANEGWDEWRSVLASAAGTTPDRVTVHALHQHDAPEYDPRAEQLLSAPELRGKLVNMPFAKEAIARAAAALASARKSTVEVTHIGLGRAKVEGVASNRRILGPGGTVRIGRMSASKSEEARAAPEGVIDPYLRSLSFWANARCVAVLTYYATHPQSYYGKGGVSAEFVGMARGSREAALGGVPHIHFNGAGGNVAAGKYNDGSPAMRPVLAGRLAAGMAAAFEQTAKIPVTARDVAWNIEPVRLPKAEAIRDEAKLQAQIADGSLATSLRLRAARDLAWVRRKQPIPLTLLELGPARVLHMPGELFVEYQIAAQNLHPEEFVAMAAYGDYGPGYIGTKVAYAEGGYETGPVSRTSPEVFDVLLSGIRKLLQ